ncbi:hypothetical protein NNO_1507 [Hydrogenimonas sp.]|nr:hypothetical protein NNO_1507 [Hydrogenimonas sp.]
MRDAIVNDDLETLLKAREELPETGNDDDLLVEAFRHVSRDIFCYLTMKGDLSRTMRERGLPLLLVPILTYPHDWKVFIASVENPDPRFFEYVLDFYESEYGHVKHDLYADMLLAYEGLYDSIMNRTDPVTLLEKAHPGAERFEKLLVLLEKRGILTDDTLAKLLNRLFMTAFPDTKEEETLEKIGTLMEQPRSFGAMERTFAFIDTFDYGRYELLAAMKNYAPAHLFLYRLHEGVDAKSEFADLYAKAGDEGRRALESVLAYLRRTGRDTAFAEGIVKEAER